MSIPEFNTEDILKQTKQNEVTSKLATATQKKDSGDAAFKAGDVKGALRGYHEALLWVMGLDKSSLPGYQQPDPNATDSEKTKNEIDELLEKLHANISACHIKQGNWKRALESAEKALAKNPENTKATFRKGKALGELGFFEKAEKILSDLISKNPSDAGFKAELNRLRTVDAERERKHSQKYRGFLSKDKGKAPERAPAASEKSVPLPSGSRPTAHIEEVDIEPTRDDDDDDGEDTE